MKAKAVRRSSNIYKSKLSMLFVSRRNESCLIISKQTCKYTHLYLCVFVYVYMGTLFNVLSEAGVKIRKPSNIAFHLKSPVKHTHALRAKSEMVRRKQRGDGICINSPLTHCRRAFKSRSMQ